MCRALLLPLALSLGLSVAFARAVPIPLENAGFELPGTEKQKGFDKVPGWKADGVVSDSGVETGYTPSEGSWSAYLMNGDAPIYQLTDYAILAGDFFELKVDAKITYKATKLRMSVVYEDGGKRIPVGSKEVTLTATMTEYTAVFTADNVPACIGHKVGVEFANATTGKSTWLGIDRVRLAVYDADLKFFASKPDPADGATNVTFALLKWTAGQNAATHNVYVGTTPELTQADLFKAQLADPACYYDTALEGGVIYYWCVDEVEAGGTVHKGTVWSFSVPSMVAYQPIPPDRALFQDPNVHLAWTAGKDGFQHDFYLSTNLEDVVRGATEAFKGTLATTTFDPGALELGKTYYWRVDEVTIDGLKRPGKIWSFETIPMISIGDPDLVGWWTLDEGEGLTAVDWSGHGHHGTLKDGARWTAGLFNGGVSLISNAHVEVPPLNIDSNNITITAWLRREGRQRNMAGLVLKRGSAVSGLGFGKDNDLRYFWRNQYSDWSSGLVLPDMKWSFVALVVTPTKARIYLNSETNFVVHSGAHARDPFDSVTRIGRNQVEEFIRGIVDDVRFYTRALTPEEIRLVIRGESVLAWNPQPTRAADVDIRDAVELSWSAGETTVQHNVYFGRDAQAVADADSSSDLCKGRQAGTSYSLAGLVEIGGGEYFWRIDEVEADGTIIKGNVWKFTIPGYLIIDDFESYMNDSPHRVFQTWIDSLGFSPDEYFPQGNPGNGTGAGVGHDVWSADSPYYSGAIIEGNITYDGAQSMPLDYNNVNSPYYSEAVRTWAVVQNWTAYGADTFALYLYGDPNNGADPLYVSIADAAGKAAMFVHPDPNIVQIENWTEWKIPLSDITAAGVNVKAIKKVTIGVGDRASSAPGDAGSLYIDGLRLTRPMP